MAPTSRPAVRTEFSFAGDRLLSLRADRDFKKTDSESSADFSLGSARTGFVTAGGALSDESKVSAYFQKNIGLRNTGSIRGLKVVRIFSTLFEQFLSEYFKSPCSSFLLVVEIKFQRKTNFAQLTFNGKQCMTVMQIRISYVLNKSFLVCAQELYI